MANLVINALSKYESNTWGNPIPFGADATNVYLTSTLKIAGITCHTAEQAISAINQGLTRGNALAGDILNSKTAVVKGILVTGTMPNKGTLNWNPSKITTHTIEPGYYSGGTLDSTNAYNAGYKSGTTAGYKTGTAAARVIGDFSLYLMPNNNYNANQSPPIKDQGDGSDYFFCPMDTNNNPITSITRTLLPGTYSWVGGGVCSPHNCKLQLKVGIHQYALQLDQVTGHNDDQLPRYRIMLNGAANPTQIGSAHGINGSGTLLRFGFKHNFVVRSTDESQEVVLSLGENYTAMNNYTTFVSSVINR